MTLVLRLARDTLLLPAAPVALGVAIALATKSPVVRRTAGALAMASGILIAHFAAVGVPRLPPIDTIGWVPVATALAASGIVVERHAAARVALAFAVTAAAVWLIGRPVWQGGGAAALWSLLAGAITAGLVASLDRASRRLSPAATLVAFSLTMAGGAIACLRGHSALLAQVLGANAVAVGASGLAAIFFESAKASVGVAAVSVVAVLVYGRLYATLSVAALALLVASAAAPCVASCLPRGRSVAAIVLASVLAAAAAFAA